MFIATLIAAQNMTRGDISLACDRLAATGCEPGNTHWIEDQIACDIAFAVNPDVARTTLYDAINGVDIVVQPIAGRSKKLLISDMDSTMITVECIDELADYAGLRKEVSEVTERAMRGELDFAEALAGRVALLKGLPISTLAQCYRERVKLMPGGKTLVQTMRNRGAYTILISGGFTHFADPVAADIGFDLAISNILGVAGGALDGTVRPPIIDAAAKAHTLQDHTARLGLDVTQTLAVGDGANDIPMIQNAGLGIAYHAKQKAADAADAHIRFGDLSALLYAQGIGRREWV